MKALASIRAATAACLALAAAVAAGCGEGTGPVEPAAPSQDSLRGSLVVIAIEGLGTGDVLPDTLAGLSPGGTAWTRLTEEFRTPVPDVTSLIAARASSNGLLVVSIDQELAEGPQTRDNILIESRPAADGTLSPVSSPADVAADLARFDWASAAGRSAAATMLFSKYLPDLLVARMTVAGDTEAIEVCSYWLAAVDTLGSTLVLLSSPGPGTYRGWVLLAGRHIRSTRLEGLTAAGLLTTMEILLGLPWDPSTSAGVPAAAALDFNPMTRWRAR
jgi:hypothetical protein